MTPPILKDVLTAFSPQTDFLAITAGDGRVKTWDVSSGRLAGEIIDLIASPSEKNVLTGISAGHLAVEYAALAWGSGHASSTKKTKKKSGTKGSSVIALGTSAGAVLGWDPAAGELKWRTSNCSSGGVRSLVFQRNGQSIFSAWADGMVCQLDSSSGDILEKFRVAKSGITCIAVSEDGSKLLAAGSDLKLYDLASKKRLRKFTGHPSPVKALAFTHDGKYALSSAVEDRHVAIWDCDDTSSEHGAVMALSMEKPALALDCVQYGEHGNGYQILAITETGVAYIWYAESFEDLRKIEPVKISVAPKDHAKTKKSQSCVLAAKFLDSESQSIYVAHGTPAKPSFETLLLNGRTGSIVLGSSQGGLLLPAQGSGSTIKASREEVTVLGADNAADATITKPIVESDSAQKHQKRKRRADVSLDENQETPNKPEQTNLIVEEDGPKLEVSDEEPTMEERIKALGLMEDIKNDNEEAERLVIPKTDSADVLLTQALQSEDNNLLERCLSLSSDGVITNTVCKLKPSVAMELLKVSISKIQASPRRGLTLVPWIRAVLLHHTSFIMSSPAMRPVLSSLCQVIDARLLVFRQLVSLSGRLELIIAQIKANETHAKEFEDAEKAVIYEEEDTDEEVEDVMEEESDMDEEDQEDRGLYNGIHLNGGRFPNGISDESDEDI